MSIRITDEAHAALKRAAKREQRPKGALAERILREGLEMDRFPGLIFIGTPPARRPAISGTGLDVWEVVATAQNCKNPDEALDLLNIKPMHLRTALDYYKGHREEIDQQVERNSRPPEDWDKEYPGIFKGA